MACGPRVVVQREPETQRKRFWKKRKELPEQPEPSLFCQHVWTALDFVPFVTPPSGEEPGIQETCDEERKNPLQMIASLFKRRSKSAATSSSELRVAFSEDFHPTKSQEKLIHKCAQQFREYMDDPHHLEERLDNVAWGGSTSSKWWLGHDGTSLLASYLRIMNWPEVRAGWR